jgi:Lon protease-like protein
MACLLLAHGNARAQATPRSEPPAADAMPPVIPIFPLEATMLFPGMSRPLHIFEPRYRAMVADALKGDRMIGMATLKPGYEAEYEGRPPVYDIGCAGVITEFEELPGGRFNIVLRCVVKFRIAGEDDSRAYRLARVDAVPETLDDNERTALHKHRQRLEALITEGSASKVPPDTTDEALVNMVAQYLSISHTERQGLLELRNALLRVRALIELIEAKEKPPRAIAFSDVRPSPTRY